MQSEMLKASGDLGILWLTNVIKQVWQTVVIPLDWKKGIVLPIYKGKSSLQKLWGHITSINTREGICYGSA